MTKRKDDEDTSSSIYNAMDHRDPVLDFQKYFNDDENIVDEVSSANRTASHNRLSFHSPSRRIFQQFYCVTQYAFMAEMRGRLYAVLQWPSGNMPDCGVRGPRFGSHRRRLCLSRQPLRYTALGTGCAPLLQCLG